MTTLRAAAALAIALALGALAPWAPSAHAQAVVSGSEEKIKAAYLYRLLNYVDYPAQAFETPASPYVIGVVDDDVVAAELAQLVANKPVNNREVVVRRIGPGAAAGTLHVMFVSRADHGRQAYLLQQSAAAPVLTVTETGDGLDQGAVLNFRIVDGRVRFDISLPAAERAGLRLSSRLLGLAYKVVKPD